MIDFSHDEAILFRVLSGLFGRDQVVPHMSAFSVCGGQVPDKLAWPRDEIDGRNGNIHQDPLVWARNNKCLFTIVDQNDQPCMVIEFANDITKSIDLVALEHERFMGPLLSAAGIRYVTITSNEFAEILDPSSSMDMVSFLQSKIEPGEGVLSRDP